MERSDLEMAVAIADSGTISGAATRLRTAQPALSRRLSRLELEMGGPLFDRGRHGASATAAGRVLVEFARTALASVVDVEVATKAAVTGHGGHLRIGTAPTLGADLLPEALARHRTEQPAVTVDLSVNGDSPELQRLVAEGELDVAVTVLGSRLEPGLRVATAAPQPMAVALHPDHPLAARQRVPRSALAGVPMIALTRGQGMRILLDEVFEEFGAQPEISIELTEREMLMPFVAAGLGATVLPERFARQRTGTAIALRPLSPPLARSVGAVVRSGPRSRLVEDFIATLRYAWPEQ